MATLRDIFWKSNFPNLRYQALLDLLHNINILHVFNTRDTCENSFVITIKHGVDFFNMPEMKSITNAQNLEHLLRYQQINVNTWLPFGPSL